MRAGLLVALLLVITTPVAAQLPQDPRLRTIDYNPGRIIPLQGAPGYQLTVELSADETVQNVALGDASAWQVSVNKKGDHLFIKAQQGGASTNLTVITNVRVYNFELQAMSLPTSDMAYAVRFNYASANGLRQSSSDSDHVIPRVAYRIRGDDAVRPSFVRDDGDKTYIGWPTNRAIPAVFALDDTGQETLVDGMMRDDLMVVDRVVTRLIFRIDQRVARADRIAKGKTR